MASLQKGIRKGFLTGVRGSAISTSIDDRVLSPHDYLDALLATERPKKDSSVDTKDDEFMILGALTKVDEVVGKSKEIDWLWLDPKERVPKDTVEELFKFGPHIIWACLRWIDYWRGLAINEHSSMKKQGTYVKSENMTKKIVEELLERYDKNKATLYSRALTFRYGRKRTTALELAIKANWVAFFSLPRVAKCMEYMDKGYIYRYGPSDVKYKKVESVRDYFRSAEEDELSMTVTSSINVSASEAARRNEARHSPLNRLTGWRSAIYGIPQDMHDKLIRLPSFLYWFEVANFVVFAMLFSAVLFMRDTWGSHLEIALWITALSRFLDEVTQIWQEKPDLYFSSLVNIIDICLVFLVLVALALRLSSLYFSNEELLELSYDVMACDAILVYLRLLVMITKSESLGLLMAALRRMVSSMLPIASLLLAVMFSFAVVFRALCQSKFGGTQDVEFTTAFAYLFRALFGDFDYEQVRACHPYLGHWVFSLYLIVAGIILLNSVLVAVLASTYERISENAAEEFKFTRATGTIEYFLHLQKSLLVPPWNLLFYPIGWIFICCTTHFIRFRIRLVFFRYLLVNPIFTLFLVCATLFSFLTWPFTFLSITLAAIRACGAFMKSNKQKSEEDEDPIRPNIYYFDYFAFRKRRFISQDSSKRTHVLKHLFRPLLLVRSLLLNLLTFYPLYLFRLYQDIEKAFGEKKNLNAKVHPYSMPADQDDDTPDKAVSYDKIAANLAVNDDQLALLVPLAVHNQMLKASTVRHRGTGDIGRGESFVYSTQQQPSILSPVPERASLEGPAPPSPSRAQVSNQNARFTAAAVEEVVLWGPGTGGGGTGSVSVAAMELSLKELQREMANMRADMARRDGEVAAYFSKKNKKKFFGKA